MTPSEYTEFRESLGQSSGFQSCQYRLIEFLVGNKQRRDAAAACPPAGLAERLEAILAAPELYDEAIALLARRGFASTPRSLARDCASRMSANEAC